MGSVPPLLSFLLMIAAGWVNRHQLIVIEFLQAENRLLKDRLCGRRLRFTDAERALLARKAKAIGRKALHELDTIVSPDTLLRWHRRLVAQKLNFAERRSAGRPGIMRHISELIVRMAQDNRRWGYTRIQGALANLNHKVGRGTIANVLKRNGIEPAPERSRRTPWSTFLKAHWRVLAASDFLTVEVWTGRGLVTHYLLLVIILADRVVHIAGITTRPDESWMLQIAGNITDAQSGALHAKALPHHRSRYEILAAISATGSEQWNQRDPPAADVAESERLRRALRTLDQRRMPRSHDLRWAEIATPCRSGIHDSLSRRTQSPRSGQPIDCSHGR